MRRSHQAPSALSGEGVICQWPPTARVVVSILLILHLAAVVIAPCATPPPRSDLALSASRLLEPYLSGAFLFHGYRFFAPNPGPGHLVRYEVTPQEELSATIEGVFPDLQQQWPRAIAAK